MDRRTALTVVGAAAVATRRAWAQTPAKVPRVSIVSFGHADAEVSQEGRMAFEAGLRQHGWIPGSAIALEYHWADASAPKLAGHVTDIIRSTPA